MNNLWKYISYLGIPDSTSNIEKRNLVLVNRLNFIMLVFTTFLSITFAIFREINDGVFSIHTKKIIWLSALCIVNLILSYFKQVRITRINLIILPSFITVYLPIFFGYVQDFDFLVSPILIITLSFIPVMTLRPDFRNMLYLFSFMYFLCQITFIDTAMTHFGPSNLTIPVNIPNIHFYLKPTFFSIFIFIQLVLFYYRSQNTEYEKELLSYNELLKAHIEELRTTQQQLVHAEKMASLGILTAGVAHEINNPLNFIMGAYEGLKDHNDKTKNKEVENLLNALYTGVMRAADIVKSLNQFSRNSKNTNEDCNIHNIIDNCLTMVQGKLKGQIAIEKKYHATKQLVKGNVGDLHQVFVNILTNAQQAILNTGKINILTFEKVDSIVIEIQDTGTGIPEESISKITDPFFTTKTPGNGTGLGLYISYNIINDHHGKLEFDSGLDKGTTVRVLLPLHV